MARDATTTAPQPIMRRAGHEKALELLAEFPPGDVLDAACGEGALSVRLRDAGFTVRCCDIDPGLMKAERFESKQVDLNTGQVDYPDASFDYVVCMNGLHRLFYIGNALAEFNRLLRPGGRLLICIPNYVSIVRRMRFLLTGTIAKNIARQTYKQTTDDPRAHVRTPLTAPQLSRALKGAGFRLDRIAKDRTQKRGMWLAPIALIVKLLAPVIYHRERDVYALDLANCGTALVGGHHLFLLASKRD